MADQPATPSDSASLGSRRADGIRFQFGITAGDQVVVVTLVVAAVVWGAWRWQQVRESGLRPIEIHRLEARQLDSRIDLNTATWVELMQLPNVGESLAERIIAYRKSHGLFKDVDELLRVKGIGPKTLTKLRPLLVVE